MNTALENPGVLHVHVHIKHFPDCMGQVKGQIWASSLKDQKITVARIRQDKSVLWTDDFQYKK